MTTNRDIIVIAVLLALGLAVVFADLLVWRAL